MPKPRDLVDRVNDAPDLGNFILLSWGICVIFFSDSASMAIEW